jgi:hypothetical protein
VLPKNLTTAEACSPYSQSKDHFALTSWQEGASSKIINFIKTQEIQHQMARVRSTARVTHDGEETEATETAPISEVMKRSGLVVTEGTPDEGAPATEAERADIEEGDTGEEEIDYNTAMPSKPSHLDFGKSTVSEANMAMMTKLSYFREADKGLIRFGGEETIPKPENDEVIVFKSFFKAGLRFPLHGMIADVLENFEIYLHQLTPNAIVRLSVYIWALRSQGVEPLAEAFCRVHELHYQTKSIGPKKRRIITVTEAIEETPPPASVSKAPAVESSTATKAAPAEAATAEDANLESTLSDIDNILLDMAAEEAATATEETMAIVPGKEKEIAEDTSEEENFNFWNLIGQELSKAEKKELRDYAISCGYQPGAMLFGGIDDESLGCLRDRTWAKVVGTLSKSIGFLKLETDISRYRRQHIVGSLFYSNFKVKTFLRLFIVFNNEGVF